MVKMVAYMGDGPVMIDTETHELICIDGPNAERWKTMKDEDGKEYIEVEDLGPVKEFMVMEFIKEYKKMKEKDQREKEKRSS